MQREKPKPQSGNMSVEEMLKKIMEVQAQLTDDVRNNQLANQNLEKQFGQLTSAQNSRQQGGCLATQIQILNRSMLYAKYVKEIVANKRRLTEYETITLTEECTSKIKNKLLMKLKDSGCFTRQITIGQSIHARGLCDLRASINLIPTSLYKKLSLGSPKPTTVILQLADRSVARPEGVVEDVLVQVGSLIFPVNFVVLNFEPGPEVPFILGCPFLATGKAMIDVVASQFTMRAHDKVEDFDVCRTLKMPPLYEELSAITCGRSGGRW
ncbi:uncharacterized protein LOC107013229 [Solanum pennellii]|uniref:Uncharacterized protein LOC107013229 n=1 Tax=Solanum pennellii TaxID=28526 RepID=A0ABM1GBI2_SOLPN|nr:uncharacterized protein LOC107013229 [Solanum pennellii]